MSFGAETVQLADHHATAELVTTLQQCLLPGEGLYADESSAARDSRL